MVRKAHRRPLGIIVLAAGKGTRMESDIPKVLHQVAGQPMLSYVLDSARKLKAGRVAVVVGHGAAEVQKRFSHLRGLRWVRQPQMLGTGDAVRVSEASFRGFRGEVLVLYGDIPGVKVETLRRLAMVHESSNHAVTLLSAELEEPAGYGRVLLNSDGSVARIVEDKDATEEEKQVQEINTGIGMYDARFLFPAVRRLRPANKQGEYYLTDLVAMARKEGRTVGRLRIKNPLETLGINDRSALADVSGLFYSQKANELMEAGVTMDDPVFSALDPSVHVERDSRLGSSVRLAQESRLGRKCDVGAGALIEGSELADGVRVGRGAAIRSARIGRDAFIGDYTVIGSADPNSKR